MSSCENSGQGARYVCRLIRDIFFNEADFLFSLSAKTAAELIVLHIQKRLRLLADENDSEFFSYGSTLSFVCLHRKKKLVMTFSLGDSRIYEVKRNNKLMLCDTSTYSPYGCCSTVTRGAEHDTKASFSPYSQSRGFVLCTDGMWKSLGKTGVPNEELIRQMLSMNNGFFRRIFNRTKTPDDCSFIFMTVPKRRELKCLMRENCCPRGQRYTFLPTITSKPIGDLTSS